MCNGMGMKVPTQLYHGPVIKEAHLKCTRKLISFHIRRLEATITPPFLTSWNIFESEGRHHLSQI